MKRTGGDWRIRLTDDARRTTVRHRNRPVVIVLTIVTVGLMVTGLLADLRLGSSGLMTACYAGTIVSGVTLLAFLFSKRLRVERPPTR